MVSRHLWLVKSKNKFKTVNSTVVDLYQGQSGTRFQPWRLARFSSQSIILK